MTGPISPGVTLTDLTAPVLDLVVPAGHPLARRHTVPITELDGPDCVDFPVSYGIRTVADRAFATASVTRRVALEITDLPTGVAYVRGGLGVALSSGQRTSPRRPSTTRTWSGRSPWPSPPSARPDRDGPRVPHLAGLTAGLAGGTAASRSAQARCLTRSAGLGPLWSRPS
ncbi:LysR substrate-binding domain-containing protein, partial [Streptomyces sp. NPDC048279]|uniref:LysR substrate-binding domain-containing protein n=1 Tax=Streptomyces sp. NPDC048279 TaxID=3154714 RepID=UPI003434E9A1